MLAEESESFCYYCGAAIPPIDGEGTCERCNPPVIQIKHDWDGGWSELRGVWVETYEEARKYCMKNAGGQVKLRIQQFPDEVYPK